MSQKSAEGICEILSRHYTKVVITTVDNRLDLDKLVARRPDLVFLGMNFIIDDELFDLRSANKIWLSQYLDDYKIRYTGSDQTAHKLELNKHLAKRQILNSGLNTSPFYVIYQGNSQNILDVELEFPLFVKPTDRGASLGIDNKSVVHDFDQLSIKVDSIASELSADSLIEEYLPGREFSVAVLGNEYSNDFSVMPIELVAPKNKNGDRLLSQEVKSADSEHFIKVTDLALKARICVLAINAFHALGARDYGRIDIRLDRHGIPQFLEANLIPSLLAGYGNFPKACLLNKNLSYQSMLIRIVYLAFARNYDASEYIITEEKSRPTLFSKPKSQIPLVIKSI
ncbi:MAG TPA: D-alanine--D-alanine ligase [Candidatus Saccharimonadia bacterium]|nr:D-alanine--D-alanine ligase [Candidatus Saccharimonadia bacterium]